MKVQVVLKHVLFTQLYNVDFAIPRMLTLHKLQ